MRESTNTPQSWKVKIEIGLGCNKPQDVLTGWRNAMNEHKGNLEVNRSVPGIGWLDLGHLTNLRIPPLNAFLKAYHPEFLERIEVSCFRDHILSREALRKLLATQSPIASANMEIHRGDDSGSLSVLSNIPIQDDIAQASIQIDTQREQNLKIRLAIANDRSPEGLIDKDSCDEPSNSGLTPRFVEALLTAIKALARKTDQWIGSAK